MTIAIDGNEANIENRVGIGRYAFNVLEGLYKLNKDTEKPDNFRIYLKNKPLSQLPQQTINWKYHVKFPPFIWSQIALPAHLFFESQKPDVLYSTSHYISKFIQIPSIISIMDLSYIHFPQMFKSTDLYKLKNWTAISVKKAVKIVTISQFTKKEIVKYYGVDPDKIEVAYPGVDHKKYKPGQTSGKKDYLLYVGTIQPRKNITGLIEAFSRLKNKDKLGLVIVGQKGWLYHDIFEEVKKRGLESNISFCDYVSEKQLISYYQGALCLILPSFYEGFGIPVVEAMACGCPVLASNVSSLPEIVGSCGELFDPFDTRSIGQSIERVYKDTAYRNLLIKKGLIRAKAFNWLNTAQKIRRVLKSV